MAGRCVEGDGYLLWCDEWLLWRQSEDRSGRGPMSQMGPKRKFASAQSGLLRNSIRLNPVVSHRVTG